MSGKLFLFLVSIAYLGLVVPKLQNYGVAHLVLYALFLMSAHLLVSWYFCDLKIDPHRKAVLITGCDSGFGHRLAQRLDAAGFHVFASCLFPEGTGADRLRQTCSDRLKVLPMDVSSEESVSKALVFVEQNIGSNVLWAVVNNAGMSKGSNIDFSSMNHFKETMEVNAFGPVRVTKAFLPLIKKSKGRIVNVTSLNGRVPATCMCPYVMSKYAATGFSECLSLEMVDWGVRVISIEPEPFRTPICDPEYNIRRMKAEWAEVDESILSSYGEEYFQQMEKFVANTGKITCENIDIVVDDMESAVTKLHPPYVYRPRRNLFTRALFFICIKGPFSVVMTTFRVTAKFLHYPVPCAVKI